MSEVQIHYRDEDLVVVDKPAGMLVVHAPGRKERTLVDLLSAQLGTRALPVHRLDEDTTGALALALTVKARGALEDVFRRHRAERTYLALVQSVPSPPAGRIESFLAERAGMVRSVLSGGARAVTHYRTLGRRDGWALLECRLETGRRNQIRVHMAELGCPVVGDRKYGYRPRRGERPRRVMLHSWRLSLPHPITEVRVDVRIDPSESELNPEAT